MAIVEEAGTSVLILTEGLEREEFIGSRLTRDETLRQLRQLAASLDQVPQTIQVLLPEFEWAGWASAAKDFGNPDGEALWFAVRSLVPATLMWLRVYRQNQPTLFTAIPGEPAPH